jgi:hypothetical protein
LAGTTTPAASYTTSQGNVAWTNPIVLDSAGRVPSSGEIWLTENVSYKFILKTATDVTIATYDNINGISDVTLPIDSNDVTYDPPLTGAVATTVEAKLAQTISVLDFGADPTGAIDSTSAIQAALDTGKNVYLPQGVYKTSAALTITTNNTGLYGDGSGSIIQTSSLTDDIFRLGNGSTEISGLLFQDFTVWSSVIKTAGYAFNCRFVTDSQWQNVSVGNQDLYANAGGHRLYYGWYFDRFDTVGVFGGWCVTPQDGIRMRGNANDSYSAEIVIDGNIRFARQNGTGACGVRIGGNCGGVYLRRGDVSLAETGVVIDTTLSLAATTATKRNREVFIQGFNVDSCEKWGIEQVAESVALLTMDNPWTASCGADDDGSGGILIGGGVTVIPVVSISGSPYIYNNVGLTVPAKLCNLDLTFHIIVDCNPGPQCSCCYCMYRYKFQVRGTSGNAPLANTVGSVDST